MQLNYLHCGDENTDRKIWAINVKLHCGILVSQMEVQISQDAEHLNGQSANLVYGCIKTLIRKC